MHQQGLWSARWESNPRPKLGRFERIASRGCQPAKSYWQAFGLIRSLGTFRTYISVVPILPFAVLAFCTFFVPNSSGTSGSSVLVGP